MHSIAIVVNNTVIYLKVAKRLDLKCSHHRREMIIMWCDRGVSFGGNHIARYKFIKSTGCTP